MVGLLVTTRHMIADSTLASPLLDDQGRACGVRQPVEIGTHNFAHEGGDIANLAIAIGKDLCRDCGTAGNQAAAPFPRSKRR